MSRSRPFLDPRSGEEIWFDQRSKATVNQLELLADLEGIDLDDLLDEDLSQRQVLFRCRLACDDNVIPADVLARRQERIRLAGIDPVCRICSLYGLECEGRITRHHYVPRWMMLMLENYQAYASRSRCTVPICLARHRDLHFRGFEASEKASKSIVECLTTPERLFAQKMLEELRRQRPRVWELLEGGDESSYEWQLVRDFAYGEFRKKEDAFDLGALEVTAIAEG